MKTIQKKLNAMTRRQKTSLIVVNAVIGVTSTFMSIVGVTLNDLLGNNYYVSSVVVIMTIIVLYQFVYWLIGKIYKNSVEIMVRQTKVDIECGDIFEKNSFKVIGCDNQFHTQIDDKVIAQKSLHGQLVLEHGEAKEIKKAIKEEAIRLNLVPNGDGLYTFPLGTVIKYESSIDGNTYLMLAMVELDENLEAHTNMAKFEFVLMHMWKEISRVYAANDVALPVLGTGITRFDDGPKSNENLLRCMLCTLNASGVTLKSRVKIVIFDNTGDIPLYEYKDLYKAICSK